MIPSFTKLLPVLVAVCVLFPGKGLADSGCEICGAPLGATVFLIQDKVTEEKKRVCDNCTRVAPRCFTCGLPVFGKHTELADGRVICARDARDAVLDEDEANRICRETKESLDRLFSRFLTFPETNVTVELVDRVNLQQIFKVIGNDYECPNVWGCILTRTNNGLIRHSIKLLSGLPADGFQATCAHEYTHAWLNENVPDARRQTLSQDAVEGFCELISLMLMEAQNHEAQKKLILLNAYTRGQIHSFLEVRDRYGFGDIAEWMKKGADATLSGEEPGRVRDMEVSGRPSQPAAGARLLVAQPSEAPDHLVLRGIVWSKEHPLALINDRGFEIKEEGKVKIGKTNVTVRCLEIRADSVRIRLLGSGEEQELRLKNRRD